MYLVGIDPSFSSTGLAVYDTESKELTLKAVSLGHKQGQDFQTVWKSVREQVSNISSELPLKSNQLIEVVSEEPIPSAYSSSSLFALDTTLFLHLVSCGVDKIYNTHPSFLKVVHGKNKYTKTESVELALIYIDLLKQNGLVFNWKSKRHPKNDACEAFLMLLQLMLLNGTKFNNKSINQIINTKAYSKIYAKPLYYR